MRFQEKIHWLSGVPLGIKMRKIIYVPTHMHEDILEIIFCLKGSVQFAYGYEEFTLRAGEFISVDKDAHVLHSKEDNICISYYISLKEFQETYPFITNLLFVCEGMAASSQSHTTQYHRQLKGILISLLHCFLNRGEHAEVHQSLLGGTNHLVELFMNHFDIVFYYQPDLKLKPELMERNRQMMGYLQKHAQEQITLDSIGKEFNLSKTYVSEFLRLYEVGFRKSLSYIRANNSERFLLNTDMTIVEISETCGFSDPKYYYKAFKEWYKCTPRQFRIRYRDRMHVKLQEKNVNEDEAILLVQNMMQTHYLEMFLE